uniref:USP domain-containing protein n=1 Tax=Leersia perrieri TaxID=77586 RepID=A0A0D9XA15_9ORYZ
MKRFIKLLGDSQIPASGLEDAIMVKTSELQKGGPQTCTVSQKSEHRMSERSKVTRAKLKPNILDSADSTKVEQISQSKDAVKVVDVHPQKVFHDVKVEEMDAATADSCIPAAPPPSVSPPREEDALMESGSDVEKNETAVKPEASTKDKMVTSSAKVTTEGKGKTLIRDVVYDKAQDISSVVSIEGCLELHFESQMVEWSCVNCSKAAEKPGIILGEYSSKEDMIVREQSEHSERITCQSVDRMEVEGASSSRQPLGSDSQHQVMLTADSITKGITPGTISCEQDLASENTHNKNSEFHEGVQEPANELSEQGQNASTLDKHKGKQISIRGSNADQVDANQKEREGRNQGAILTYRISKLPPVLTIQLQRNLAGAGKAREHVSFEEILDVGCFMDPSSEDKDNSQYRLVGVIEHVGLGTDKGHFLAYVKPSPPQQTNGPSSCFRADDAIITEISLEEVLNYFSAMGSVVSSAYSALCSFIDAQIQKAEDAYLMERFPELRDLPAAKRKKRLRWLRYIIMGRKNKVVVEEEKLGWWAWLMGRRPETRAWVKEKWEKRCKSYLLDAMEEGKRARASAAAAADASGIPRKSPRLEEPPAADAAAEVIGAGTERCEHFMSDQDHVDHILAGIRLREVDPVCCDYTCNIAGESSILVCLECELRLCNSHCCLHAMEEEHWIGLCGDSLTMVYCFKCEKSYDMSVKDDDGGMTDDDDVWVEEIRLTSVTRWMMGESLPQIDHVSAGLANWNAHAIKGILNLGNTCYLNALVQCLLVLGKLQARMLGLDAPSGILGTVLSDLFEQTYGVDSARRSLLDTSSLLRCVRRLDSRFEGTFMQDSHELLCCLRNRLDEEEMRMNSSKMQDGALSAVPPSVFDSIFGGQLSSTKSCKCCSFSSVSHVGFCDLSVALPSKGSPSKSLASPSWTEGHKCQQKIHTKLFPAIDKSNTQKKMWSLFSDSRSPSSELEDVVFVKISEPLRFDFTQTEQISPSKIAVSVPLQTLKDKVQGKAIDFLPQNMLPDVKVEELDLTKTNTHIPEDIGPPPPVSPLREENPWIESGSDVGKNDSGVLDDVFSEPEISSEARTGTFSEEFTTENKEKTCSSDLVCDKTKDINSIASIDECLKLYFKAEMMGWTCENCSKVAHKSGTILGEYGEPMMSSANEDTAVDGDQSEQSEKITCQSKQSNKRPECHEGGQEAIPSCVPDEKQANLLTGQEQNATTPDEGGGMQVKLPHRGHKTEKNQNWKKDRNKGSVQTLISKLPPVLVIHLIRNLWPHNKVIGHVSFKEILDVGLFVDPSSEDKDNLSYRLVGVIEHHGPSPNVGHCLAYVRASPRQQTSGSSSWFRASDDDIREIAVEEVLKFLQFDRNRTYQLRAFNAMAVWKSPKRRVRAVEIAEDPWKGKAPRLELPAAVVEIGSSSGGQTALDASDDPRDSVAAMAIRDTDGERCKHINFTTDEIETILSTIDAEIARAPICEDEICMAKGSRLVMVCPECDWYFCIGGKANRAKPQGHIREHAFEKAHWVALRYKDPYEGYCFQCEDSLTIGDEEGEEGLMVNGDDEHECIIRGILNLGNTCYLNAVLQCLFVIGKLRSRMFRSDAPSGMLADILHDLFVDTNSVSYNTQGVLDPRCILACVRSLKPEFRGTFMHDSHELLCFLRNQLNEDEQIMRHGNMKQGAPSTVAPTAIDSIFCGQLSDTLSCKRCSVKSVSHGAFYDLSVPLPPKGTPAKSVASPSRNEKCISQQKICTKLFPAIVKTNTEKICTISETASESEDTVMVKTSEPLKVDSNHLEHFLQSKDDAHGPLQAPIRKENALIASNCDVAKTNSAVLGNAFNGPENSIDAKVDNFLVQVTAKDNGKARNSDVVYDEAVDINSFASIEACLELYFKAEMIERRCENCSMVDQKESTISGKDCEQAMACTNVNRTIDGDQAKQSKRKTCQTEHSCDLIRLDVECSSSSRQPHVSDGQHQVMPAVDMKTKGGILEMSCENDLPSCSIGNKKSDCPEDAQEDVSGCCPAENLSNLLVGLCQNASTQDQGTGKEVNLGDSTQQVEKNQYDQHGMNEGSIQTCLISKLPSILVIQLKRNLGPLKVSGHVSFKEILDMKVFLHPSSEDKNNSSYRLVGVVEHQGLGKDLGHYVAYVRPSHPQQTNGSSSWFCASDANVREISFKEVLKCEAYLLFYERMEG